MLLFFLLRQNLLFIGFEAAFYFLDILAGRQNLGTDTSVKEHIANSAVIVHMFSFNADLTM